MPRQRRRYVVLSPHANVEHSHHARDTRAQRTRSKKRRRSPNSIRQHTSTDPPAHTSVTYATYQHTRYTTQVPQALRSNAITAYGAYGVADVTAHANVAGAVTPCHVAHGCVAQPKATRQHNIRMPTMPPPQHHIQKRRRAQHNMPSRHARRHGTDHAPYGVAAACYALHSKRAVVTSYVVACRNAPPADNCCKRRRRYRRRRTRCVAIAAYHGIQNRPAPQHATTPPRTTPVLIRAARTCHVGRRTSTRCRQTPRITSTPPTRVAMSRRPRTALRTTHARARTIRTLTEAPPTSPTTAQELLRL
ncbi:hypothetical protein TNCT_192341 [Trichonephila clavata]|uniref:Uncharacterized protein n=1 Tax=Trichonephila clavata TaxID=2740835 RepID=A0A8X6G3Y5_TRICU|nr:hypothetical protein TNCT_192341 [Trichonephila clavata]